MSDKPPPPRSGGLVFRITGLPIWTTIEQLKAGLAHFPDEAATFSIVETTMCISAYNDRTKTAITQLSPHCPEVLAQLLNGASYVTRFGDCDIRIDKDFYGLTPLYATYGPIKADIVALSGLDGHAYGSWRAKTHARRMWVRDFLPEDLPNYFTRGLLEELAKARESETEMKRPIVFIGHSFGGIIIFQSLVRAKERTNEGFSSSLLPATYATIFFGTPHRGLITDDIKAMLGEDSPRKALVDSINESSELLKHELDRFNNYSDGIKIVSFYETKQTRKLKKGEDGRWSRSGEYFTAVETGSAILELSDRVEDTLPSEGDHSDMINLCHRDDLAYTSILSHLKRFRQDDNVIGGTTSVGRKTGDSLRRLLESGLVDVNERNNGRTLLHEAVAKGDIVTVSVLLQYKADIAALDGKHQTALQVAAAAGYPALVEMLLESGAKAHTTALHSAVANGYLRVVELLLEHGADLSVVDSGKETFLHTAAAGGYDQVVELLLNNGAEINATAQNQDTALHIAVTHGYIEVVKILLEYGAGEFEKGPGGRSALEIAAAGGYDQILKLLLAKGAHTKAKDFYPAKSALFIAAAKGHDRVVELLLKNVPEVLVRTSDMTALHISAKEGHTEVADLLLKFGADMEDEMYGTGQTALYLAGTARVVELLLKNGANISAENRAKTNGFGKPVKGFTKLHDAASWGQNDIVKVLLDYGVDVNVRDSDGHTAAYYACVTGHWYTLEFLERNGGVTTLATSWCVIG